MTTTQRTYRPADRAAKAKLESEARDLALESVRDFANRVLHRLNAKPRYQSIGHNKYVYVGDVAEAMEREMKIEEGN